MTCTDFWALFERARSVGGLENMTRAERFAIGKHHADCPRCLTETVVRCAAKFNECLALTRTEEERAGIYKLIGQAVADMDRLSKADAFDQEKA